MGHTHIPYEEEQNSGLPHFIHKQNFIASPNFHQNGFQLGLQGERNQWIKPLVAP